MHTLLRLVNTKIEHVSLVKERRRFRNRPILLVRPNEHRIFKRWMDYCVVLLQASWCSRKYSFCNLVHTTSSKKNSKQESSFVIFVQSSCPTLSLNDDCNTLYSKCNIGLIFVLFYELFFQYKSEGRPYQNNFTFSNKYQPA
jgi:hypothetical protein